MTMEKLGVSIALPSRNEECQDDQETRDLSQVEGKGHNPPQTICTWTKKLGEHLPSSRVSATEANMSGSIRPHITPKKVFIHSTDSGMRFAVA